MKKQNKIVIPKILVALGVCLLFAGGLILVSWQWNIHSSIEKSEEYVKTIKTLIPRPQGAVLEERNNNALPSLTVDGKDFVGIIEMPRYESALPVGADWGNLTKYPRRFDGSIYNGTLQIGATTQKGQYDFYREISVGDTVIFTDVEGNRYTYAVTNLRYEKHADQTALNREESELTLFIKNVYDFEYLIVSCDIV